MRVGEVRHAEREEWGKPLDGVRVLAAEQMQALPYATQLLTHLGADVVKVEPPQGESGRASFPALTDADGRQAGATFLRNNLSKRSIAIDLKQSAGRELFLKLVPHFDVVAENFRAGTMARLGLDYAAIAEVAPRAIYLSLSGFGQGDSPYRDWPAYAPIAEAMAGLYEPNRKGDAPPPVVVAGALGDIGTALFAVVGVTCALRQRERTGLGQQVDVAMFDSMVAFADMVPFLWSMGASPALAAAGAIGVTGAFKAKDGYFVVAVFREHHFQRLVEAVGHPEWCQDPRFATREGWAKHTDSVIRPALEGWAASKTKLEASQELCDQGIVAGPSNRAEDLVADPHVRERDMLLEIPRPDGADPFLVVGNPLKFSRSSEGPVRTFPCVGQHTSEVLRETLQIPETELNALRKEGVIA